MNIKWQMTEHLWWMYATDSVAVAMVNDLNESPYEARYFANKIYPDGTVLFTGHVTNEFDTLADAKHWCEMMYNTGA